MGAELFDVDSLASSEGDDGSDDDDDDGSDRPRRVVEAASALPQLGLGQWVKLSAQFTTGA